MKNTSDYLMLGLLLICMRYDEKVYYKVLDNSNLDYLTFDEAALLANGSRATIYEWSSKNYFPVVHVVKASRIPRKEFEQYLEKRKLEEGDEKNGINKRKKR